MPIIRIRIIILFLLYFLPILSMAQEESLADILNTSNSFDAIVKNGERYFEEKHPSLTTNELTEGEHRDGEFVKFMRWRSFWKESLNPDGTLGDIAAYRINQQQSRSRFAATNLYENVTWTNLSHEDYITSQIGLGRTTSMGFHPTNPAIFYVGAAIGGIWKTTDGGQNYTPLGDDLPFMAVSSIIVNRDNPDIIYIAISDHVGYGPPSIGVYKSTDAGLTWQPTALSFSLSENTRIYWMEVDPNDVDKIFVGTEDGLYRTTDGFQTVNLINSARTFDVKINLGNTNIVYQGRNDGSFHRSTDGGATFSQIQDFGSGNVYMALTPLNTSKVYVRNGSDLYKSTDNGATFSPTSNTFPENNSVFLFAPNNEQTLLSGNFETHRSNDDGATFEQTSEWLGREGLPLIHVDQRNVFYNPLESDYVYYCNDGGVYRYILSTNSFENLSDGLMITQFYDIAVSQTDENIIGGGSQDNGNIYRKADGTWDDYAGTGDGMNQAIDPTDANTRYWSFQNGGLRRWVNGSNSNIVPPDQTGAAWETPYKLDPNNASRIIAGYDAVYESLDKGNNWTDLSGKIFDGALNELAIAKSNSNRIYVTRGSNLYVKNIANNTWTTKSMPASVSDIEVDPLDMDVVYITIPGYTSNSKVYKSTDAGSTWTNISGSLPNVSTGALELYETIPNAVFVGTDVGVYYLDDNLPDWQEYGALPHTRVEDIEIQYAEKLIRVGTHGRGILEAPIIITTCLAGDPDSDEDGICDANDACPDLKNNLIGTACDDGDAFTSGEKYTADCACAGGSSNISYCAAAGSGGTGSDWINAVRLNTLDITSGKSQYSDFRTESTTLTAGTSYNLAVAMNHSFSLDKVHAWIDYNQNGDFETTEYITMSDLVNNNSSGTLSIPADMTSLTTTMRVRSIYNGPTSPTACGNYFGEVEDYTVFIKCLDADRDEVCNTNDVCDGFSDLPLVLNTNPTTDVEFKAVNTIESIATINSDRNIVYKAGTSIILKAGFETKNGATLHALIETCTNTPFVENAIATNRIASNTPTSTEISTIPTVHIFPNPFANSTNIQYVLPKETSLQIKVMDLTGRTLDILLDSPSQNQGNYELAWQAPAGFSGMLFLSFQTDLKVIVKELVIVN